MRVLVPYDGGELSEQAATMAIELLAHHSLEVVLLHAAPDAQHATDAQAALDAVTARIAASTGADAGAAISSATRARPIRARRPAPAGYGTP